MTPSSHLQGRQEVGCDLVLVGRNSGLLAVVKRRFHSTFEVDTSHCVPASPVQDAERPPPVQCMELLVQASHAQVSSSVVPPAFVARVHAGDLGPLNCGANGRVREGVDIDIRFCGFVLEKQKHRLHHSDDLPRFSLFLRAFKANRFFVCFFSSLHPHLR